MTDLEQIVKEVGRESQPLLRKLKEAKSLVALLGLVWEIGRLLAVRLAEAELTRRGEAENPGERCPICGSKLESKGPAPRCIVTLLGVLRWHRKIYRCSRRCVIGQVVPSDRELQLAPHQRTSEEVKRMASILALFVPFQLASQILFLLTGVEIDPKSIWNWVQVVGKKAQQQLQSALEQLSVTQPECKLSIEKIEELLFVVGADGVKVPFRPDGGSPYGRTKWQEVKVGIAAWLKEKWTRAGKRAHRVVQRQVTALRGSVEEFEERIWWTALTGGLLQAKKVVWLSDGGVGFWGLFENIFSPWGQGILDFYHAAQYLWKGAKARFDGRTTKAQQWFRRNRHRLRKGKAHLIVKELKQALRKSKKLSSQNYHILEKLHDYLYEHLEHMEYVDFQNNGFPLGSGIVESTCKWLIQQRFKGVGMRWSESGFDNLLHLRLAWFNGDFDSIFTDKPLFPTV